MIPEQPRLIDITVAFSDLLPVWPGDPPIEMRPLERIGTGGLCNTTQIVCPSHCGTHVDPPWHFVDNGARIDDIPLDRWIGSCQVVELPDSVTRIEPATLEAAGIDPNITRILFKTSNSKKWHAGKLEFDTDYVALSPAAARWIVDRGIRLVGIDYLSIECWDDTDNIVHKTLLGNDVLAIEGIDLTGVEPGMYILVCMPMRIRDGDGAPARVALIAQ